MENTSSYIDEHGNPLHVEMNDRRNYEILDNPLRLSEIGNAENFCKVENEEELFEIVNEHQYYELTAEEARYQRLTKQMEEEFWAHVYDKPESVTSEEF